MAVAGAGAKTMDKGGARAKNTVNNFGSAVLWRRTFWLEQEPVKICCLNFVQQVFCQI